MPEGHGTSVGAALAELKRRFREAGISDPGFEARLLIEAVSGLGAADILTMPHRGLSGESVAVLAQAAARRAGGEPLHRILGWREFYGLRLALSPGTLEPRPDTETLVDAVLPFVRQRAACGGGCRILDLGTGTGAVALALLANAEGAEAVGVDLSPDAMQTAAANAERLGLSRRFRPLLSDWFHAVSGRFSLIVSNPPYIADDEMARLPAAVSRFDPERALRGGTDGLDAYRVLASECLAFLERGGRVAVEIGSSQREAVTDLFAAHGFALQDARRDLGGRDRALVFAPRENAAKA